MNDTPKKRQEVARPRSGAKSAMSKPRTSRPGRTSARRTAPRQPSYSQHARSYEQRTGAFQRHRDTLVEAHLPIVLTECQVHYNTARPHQGIAQRVPADELDAPRATVTDVDSERIRRKPVLGGLINEYTHAA